MQLSLQNFAAVVQTSAAAVQAASRQLLDLTVGSVLRAVLEANASIALWMQWLILQVLQTTRASTSAGSDLDSWMADFAVTRLPAVSATGVATFARFTPLGGALIPVGALVRTADGSQTFGVIASPGLQRFSPEQNGYVLPVGTASLDVPVQALAAGAAGNVLAGSVSLLATAIPGVDSVSNAALFQNGVDAESDAAFRTRFADFLDSRTRATSRAIGYAIKSIQQGLQYTISENSDTTGAWRPGSFVVTVDDGSGTPSSALLANVGSAVESVRPVGTIYAVQGPVVTQAAISLTLSTLVPGSKLAISAAVSTAIQSFVDALPIAAPLPVTRIAQLAYSAHPGVTNVSQVLINGADVDLAPGPTGIIKTGLVIIN